MKRLVLFVLVAGIAAAVFAQDNALEMDFASGSWNWAGERLYQNDEEAPLAKVNLLVPQSGSMLYEFNARYEDGVQDGHGGFGIHLFADEALNRASWGAGKSYLLWLNYDEEPVGKDIPEGLSAQVYRSVSNSRMDLVASISLNEYLPLLEENLSNPIPFKIEANGETGEIRIYDPSDPEMKDYFYFNVDQKDLPLKGDWAALRTNGINLSFAMGL